MKRKLLIFCFIILSACCATAFTACKGAVKIPHKHSMYHVTGNAPTCTEDGYKEFFVCDDCEKWYEDEEGITEITEKESVILPRGHKIALVEAKEATCTEDGNNAHYACSVCDEWYEDEDGSVKISNKASYVLPKTGHKLTSVVAKKATCTEDGNRAYYTCGNCDKWYSDSAGSVEIKDKTSTVLSKLGHNMTFVKQKEATCTATGNSSYYFCGNCNKFFTESNGQAEITDKTSVIIKKLSHGFENKICTECGYHEPTEGLKYYEYNDYCEVTGIGEATGTEIYIADEYNGKPVKYVDDYAFMGRKSIVSITVPYSVTYIDGYAFYNCTGLVNAVIPDSVTYIGDGVFKDCSSLESVTIPDSVTHIGGYLFDGCTGLKSVTLSGNVSVIDSSVFWKCSNLSDIYFSGTKAKWNALRKIEGWDTGIGEYTVHGKDFNYTAGHSLTLIKAKAATCTEDGNEQYYTCAYCDRWFEDSEATAEIVDKSSVVLSKFGHDMTYFGEKDATCLEKGHTAYYACGNCNKWFLDGDGKSEISNKTDVVIKKLPHSFENGVCTKCETEKIKPTEGLEYEDRGEYYELTGLGEAETDGDIVIADEIDGKPVTSIAEGAFRWKAVRTSIVIPDSVTRIGDGAFQGCRASSIIISENITEIGKNVFYGLDVTSIVIPDGVTSIGEGAFSNCTYLTSIIIPDNVLSIGKKAFSWCKRLTSVTIGTGVTSIGEKAFELCDNLKSIVIPENVLSIGNNAFEDCTSLRSVYLSKNITSFGKTVFEGCDLLHDIYFDGTEDEWRELISRGSLGYIRSDYYIHCTDGDIYTYHP